MLFLKLHIIQIIIKAPGSSLAGSLKKTKKLVTPQPINHLYLHNNQIPYSEIMNQYESFTLLSFPYEKFVSQENIDLYYYPEVKIMHFIWKKRSAGEEYRIPFLMGLEYAEKHESGYFISDIKKQGIVGPEDRKWFEKVVVPDAIQKGFIKAAAVCDGYIFTLYYLNLILKHTAQHDLPMRFSNGTSEAFQWLMNPDNH